MLENKIQSQIIKKRSFLCVGLDVDINKIPKSLLNYDDPIFEFAKQRKNPVLIFMGGGYSEPIDETVNAFESLFCRASLYNY